MRAFVVNFFFFFGKHSEQRRFFFFSPVQFNKESLRDGIDFLCLMFQA